MANQIKKKFIGNDQVDSTKILLENATALRAKKADNSEVELLKVAVDGKVVAFKEGGAEEIGYKSQVDQVALDLASEISRATLAESQINSDITGALSTANAYTDNAVLVETNRATSAENALSTSLAYEISRATVAENNLESNITNLSADLTAEVSRATLAEAQALADANAYTDAKKALIDADIVAVNTRVDNVLSNVDGVALNSLSEIVTAFQQADSDLNGAITTLATSATTAIDNEVTRAMSAETALSNRLDVVEAYKIAQEALVKNAYKKTLVQADIDNGYIDLPHLISTVPATSFLVLLDRLVLHGGINEDYTTSTVGGVTRITFRNELIGTGNQKLQVGDNIYARYSYSTI